MQDDNKDKNKLPDNSPAKTTPSEETAPKKKKSWIKKAWEAWNAWWKLTWESYRVEVEDRILMSWKRIIKFCGITIIPILYGVICSIAMWNPVEALGKATTYVMDDDYSVLLVSDSPKTDADNNFVFGAVQYFNNSDPTSVESQQQDALNILTQSNTGLTKDDITFDPVVGAIGIKNSAIKNQMEKEKLTEVILKDVLADGNNSAQFHLANEIKDPKTGKVLQDGSNVDYNPNDAGFSFKLASMWDMLKQAFNKKTDPNAADTDYKFSAPAFLTHPEVSLQNVHYSTDKKWNDKYYQHRKGWIQMMIPEGYTARAVNYISLMMENQALQAGSKDGADSDLSNAIGAELNKITDQMKPLGLWTTYQRNFLFGYMFDMMSGLLGQYVAFQLPSTLNTAMISNLSDYLTVSGPQLASLSGAMNSMDHSQIIALPNGKDLDYSQRYALSDSSYFTKGGSTEADQQRLNSATIFGNVANSDTKSSSEVGGKFINSINSLMAFANSVQAKGILGILGGQSLTSGLNDLVNKIETLINSIAGLINGNTATYHAKDDSHDKPYITATIPDVIVNDGNTDGSALAKDFQLTDDDGNEVKNSNIKYTFAKNDSAKGLTDKQVEGSIAIEFDAPAAKGNYAYGLRVDPAKAGATNAQIVQSLTFSVPEATPGPNAGISISSATVDETGLNVTVKLDNKLAADVSDKDIVFSDTTTKAATVKSVDADSIKKGSDTIKITLAAAMAKGDTATVSIKGLKDADKPTTVDASKAPAAQAPKSAFSVVKPVQFNGEAGSTTSLSDDALVQLNKTVWAIETGNSIGDMSKADSIIAKIWKVFNLPLVNGEVPTLGNIANMKDVAIFGDGSKLLSQTEFNKRADKFIKSNSSDFGGATTVNEILPTLLAHESDAKLFGLKLKNLIGYKIQGAEFGYEGIGIGLFFLTVGLYVGAMLHSFIFDRAKRLTKSKWSNWYFSKLMLMLTIGFFQVTAEVWIIYAGGWHVIGATAMCYVWLWLLMSDTMFIVIIQALWFSLKDEIIGKFLMVIVLVTSIAAGGGEFPAFSEFGFYHAISYVVPFTYVINGFDTITFAISLNGTQGDTTRFMLGQWGIEWVYIAIFLTFGMVVGAQLRMKEMNYGSHYGFAVAGAMRALGKDASDFQVLKKVTRKGRKRYYYNWKALPDAFVPELYFQCRRMYKFAGEFKWWQRKHHDFVQKPNYSDEEVIQRNE